MIIADTNIISTLARVGALGHVRRLVNVDCLYVTPATFHELRRAVEAGCDFLATTLATIQVGTELDLVELNREEVLAAKVLPDSLGAGEAESISVCVHRPGTRFLTNDKRARNYCRERAIACLDLPGILRALWVRQVLSKNQVRELLRQIEAEEGLVIKNKDEIFR